MFLDGLCIVLPILGIESPRTSSKHSCASFFASNEIEVIRPSPAPELLYYDVNRDGRIDDRHIKFLYCTIVDPLKVLPYGDLVADVDGDSDVDLEDASNIVRYFIDNLGRCDLQDLLRDDVLDLNQESEQSLGRRENAAVKLTARFLFNRVPSLPQIVHQSSIACGDSESGSLSKCTGPHPKVDW